MTTTNQGLALSCRRAVIVLLSAYLVVQAPAHEAWANHGSGGSAGWGEGWGGVAVGAVLLGLPVLIGQIVALVKNGGAIGRGKRDGNGWAAAGGVFSALTMVGGVVMLSTNGIPAAAGAGALVWGALGLGVAIGAALQPLEVPVAPAKALMPLPRAPVAAFRLEKSRLLAGWFEPPALIVPELGAGPTRARAMAWSEQQTQGLATAE